MKILNLWIFFIVTVIFSVALFILTPLFPFDELITIIIGAIALIREANK